MPRRFRIPLIGKVYVEHALDDRRLEGQPGCALQLFGQLAADRIDDVDLAALECREPRGLVRYHLEDQALYARRLAPILVEGLEDQLDTRRERDELVRPGADRRFLEPFVADLLDVGLGHDPACPCRAPVKCQKVRPRLLEPEADTARLGCFDRGHPVLHQIARGAAVTLERELYILRCYRLAVVELGAFAQHELVGETVL